MTTDQGQKDLDLINKSKCQKLASNAEKTAKQVVKGGKVNKSSQKKVQGKAASDENEISFNNNATIAQPVVGSTKSLINAIKAKRGKSPKQTKPASLVPIPPMGVL